jgi:M6 family metalloprotease-like protein
VNKGSKAFLVLLLALASSSLIWNTNATHTLSDNPSAFQTLFSDDFSNGLGKWNLVQGSWATEKGYLVGASNNSLSQISAGDSSWSDYILTLQARSVAGSTLVLLLRWLDSQNYYRIVLAGDHLEFWLRRGGNDVLLYREDSWGYPLNMKAWHEMKIKIYDAAPTIVAYIDGTPEITIKDLSGQSISSGMIGLGVDAGASSAFDDISVTTLHPDVYGPHSIILLLVEFPDVKHMMTPAQIRDSVFDTLNRYYTEVSYNLTWITGQVTQEWKILPQPATYYDLATVTTSGWSKGRAEEIIKDAINIWDKEINFKQYDYVFIATAGDAAWSYADTGLSISTNDKLAVTRAVVMGRLGGGDGWKVAAHELGHIFGLPDLYSYPIAFSGPPDWLEAAVFVGPWDLMSRSSERPQIGAWGKIKLEWLTPDQVFELLPGQQGAAQIDPLEVPGPGVHAIAIYLTSTTYFVVENRQPIGFDSVLPDKGILVSYVDESRYWRGTGPVVVQDANPGNALRWQLPHPTFTTDSGGKNLFMNQTDNLAVLLLDKSSDSYLVTAGTPDSVNIAKTSYAKAKDLIQRAETLLKETTSYQSQDAIAIVDQALEQDRVAKEDLLARTFEPFKEAVNHANQTLTLLDRAKQVEQQYKLNIRRTSPEQNFPIWIPAGMLAIGIVVGVYLVRKRRKTWTSPPV